ncbi:hypothetical protein AMTRI_Chr02g261710 [Amborella trichopoda]
MKNRRIGPRCMRDALVSEGLPHGSMRVLRSPMRMTQELMPVKQSKRQSGKNGERGEEEKKRRKREEGKKKKKKKMKMKVIVALDDSEMSFHALKWTLDHLPIFNNTQNQAGTLILLLHIHQPFDHYVFPAGPAMYETPGVLESLKKSQQQATALIFARAWSCARKRWSKQRPWCLMAIPRK